MKQNKEWYEHQTLRLGNSLYLHKVDPQGPRIVIVDEAGQNTAWKANDLFSVIDEFGDMVVGSTKDKPDESLRVYLTLSDQDKEALKRKSLEIAVKDLTDRCLELIMQHEAGTVRFAFLHIQKHYPKYGYVSRFNFTQSLNEELFGAAPYTQFNPPKLFFGAKQVLKIHGYYWLRSQSHLLEILHASQATIEANRRLFDELAQARQLPEPHTWIKRDYWERPMIGPPGLRGTIK